MLSTGLIWRRTLRSAWCLVIVGGRRACPQFLSCLNMDGPSSDGSDVDHAAWAKLTETYRYDTFSINLSNYISELVRSMPPTHLQKVRGEPWGPARFGLATLAYAPPLLAHSHCAHKGLWRSPRWHDCSLRRTARGRAGCGGRARAAD